MLALTHTRDANITHVQGWRMASKLEAQGRSGDHTRVKLGTLSSAVVATCLRWLVDVVGAFVAWHNALALSDHNGSQKTGRPK